MRKIVYYIVGLFIGCGIIIADAAIHSTNSQKNTIVCNRFTEDSQMLPYEQLYFTVGFYSDKEDYSLAFTFYPHDMIDYSEYVQNSKMYATISFSDEMDYSLFEKADPYIEIPLEKGKLLEEYTIVFGPEDSFLEIEDKEKLEAFISQKKEEYLEMKLNLYNPDGIISYSSNISINQKVGS